MNSIFGSTPKMKRPSLVVYERENEAVEFVLNHSGISPDDEILNGLERLGEREAQRCLQCQKSQVVEQVTTYSKDISCSGCVRTLTTSLGFPIPKQGLMNALFAEDQDNNIVLRSKFQNMGVKELGKMFTAFNNPSYFTRRGHGKRQRCSLHTAHPRIDEDWFQIWEEMPLHLQKKIANLDVDELSEALTNHLKNLYFCRDCRGNVLRALDLLVGFVEPDELPLDEEFCEESFRAFSLITEVDRDSDSNADSDDLEGSRMRRNGESKDWDPEGLGTIDDVDIGYLPSLSEYQVNPSSTTTKPIEDTQRDPPSRVSDDSDSYREAEFATSDYGRAKKRRIQARARQQCASDHHSHGHSHGTHKHLDDELDEDDELDDDEDDFEDDDDEYDEDSSYDDYSGSEYGYCPTATNVLCSLEEVPSLIRKAQEADQRDELSKANGQNSDRHAPTLKDGQNELLHCIGKMFLNRIKESWILQLVRAQTDELLVWLTLNQMRTNIRTTILTDEGNKALKLLLEEEDRKKEAASKKKNKKKQKKKQRKEKIKAEKTTTNTTIKPADTDSKPPTADKVKKDSNSPQKAPMSVNGHGWSEDSEARLLAQLCGQFSLDAGPDEETMSQTISSHSPLSSSTSVANQSDVRSFRFTQANGLESSFLDAVEGALDDQEDLGQEEGALTDEEIREAQLKLKEMMAKSSRAQLRANLREKFDNLCLKTS